MDTYNYGTRRSQIQPESNTAKFRPKLPRRNLSQMYYNTSCLRRCRNLPLRMCLVSWLSTSAARGGNFRAFCTTVAGRLTQPLGVRGSSSVFHCREKSRVIGGRGERTRLYGLSMDGPVGCPARKRKTDVGRVKRYCKYARVETRRFLSLNSKNS